MSAFQKLFDSIKPVFRWLMMMIITPILLLFFQNCSPTSIQDLMRGNQSSQKYSGGNGEPYDGKPSYTRLVPGLMCSDQNIAVGTLQIDGNTATVITNENSCNHIKTEIPTSQLEFSTFTSKYVGFESGVYTYIVDRNENIKKGIFTEAWCRAKKVDSADSAVEFAIEWQEQGQTANLSIMTDLHPEPEPVLVKRSLDFDRVSYAFSSPDRLSFSELRINFKQKIPGSYKVAGTFYGDYEGKKDQKIHVECLMGGEFDPIAPQFDFSDGSNRTLAVGDKLMDLQPYVNKATVTFELQGDLPKGLIFNSQSGAISGTALSEMSRQKFVVSALFPFGKISRPVSIGVGKIQIVDSAISRSATSACVDPTKNCDLHGAVELANSMMPIPLIVQISVDKVTLDGAALSLKGDLTLNGHKPIQTSIDAVNLSNHFTVTENGYLALINLKFVNGKNDTGGSISINKGSLLVFNSAFEKNSSHNQQLSSEGTGGAIDARNSIVEIFNSSFTENTTPWSGSLLGGGALYIREGLSTTIKNSTFNRNNGQHGGAIYISGSNSKNFQITNSKFNSNSAMTGGAIYDDSSYLAVNDSQFLNNTAIFDAGAIYYQNADRAWIQNSDFDGNSGGGIGSSAIYWQGFTGIYRDQASILYVLESKFINHTSGQPNVAVLLNYSGTTVIRGSQFLNNLNLTNCKTLFSEGIANIISLGSNVSSDGTCQ